MFPVAILAGGLATRIRPMTQNLPKALLSIAGKPFIFHQLELLRKQGADRVVLCLGHLAEQVVAAVGNGRQFGLAIQYSFDGSELLGTGGALKQALPLLGDSFFVLNGDSYLRCSLVDIQTAFELARRPALMTVLRNDGRWDRSNIVFRNGEVIEYDKTRWRSDMTHIDFGISVLSSSVFSRCGESRAFDLADICRDLSRSGQLAAVEVSDRFYEVGSVQGIQDTEAHLSDQLVDT
jgi:N-acetyl-alpha-D-muramate 1-phosphate uridylyltransferase